MHSDRGCDNMAFSSVDMNLVESFLAVLYANVQLDKNLALLEKLIEGRSTLIKEANKNLEAAQGK